MAFKPASNSPGKLIMLGRTILFMTAQLKLRLGMKEPKTYNEKVQYKAAYDRREIITFFSDKLAVRNYVAAKAGAKYLTEVYASGHDLTAINWSEIPREYVFKVTHGSGGVVIVSDRANKSAQLPKRLLGVRWPRYVINPDCLVQSELIALAKHLMKLNYAYYLGCGRIPEWGYWHVQPGYLLEELLVDELGGNPRTYRFYMFNGDCQFISVSERDYAFSGFKVKFTTVMNSTWEKLNIRLNDRPSEDFIEKPKNFAEMLEVAVKLSSEIDFVRVDLYNVDGRIVFGELTNYPNAGYNKYQPPDFDLELGSKLVLDQYR